MEHDGKGEREGADKSREIEEERLSAVAGNAEDNFKIAQCAVYRHSG